MRTTRALFHGGKWTMATGMIAVIALAGCTVVYQEPPPRAVYYQQAPPPPPPAPAPAAADPELEGLLAPIALYPDPLLASLLPASTYPQQVQDASQWVAANPSPADDAIAQQPWDPSVQAMAHYPEVLKYMAENPDWTQSLGSAYANRQADVMAAIQDLRAKAQAQGNLADTPQEVVVQQGATIMIEPADPAVLYVPRYDPVVVYVGYSPLVFDVGWSFGCGIWLVGEFDWYHHCGFYGGWHDWHQDWVRGSYGWRHGPGWVQPHYARWSHDTRWGAAPRAVARGHYAVPAAVRTHPQFQHAFSHSAPAVRGRAEPEREKGSEGERGEKADRHEDRHE